MSRDSLRSSAPPSPQVKFLVSWKLRAAKRPRVPSCWSVPGPEQTVGVVLDQGDVRPRGQHGADALDVAGDARVVHHDHRADGLVQQGGEVGGVETEGPPLDVAEDQAGTLSRVGERRRREREGGHDHRVPGPDVEEHRGELQGRRARRGQQHLLGTRVLGEQCRGPLRELATGRGVAAAHGLLDVGQLPALESRLVERDVRQLGRADVGQFACVSHVPLLVQFGHQGRGRPT